MGKCNIYSHVFLGCITHVTVVRLSGYVGNDNKLDFIFQTLYGCLCM